MNKLETVMIGGGAPALMMLAYAMLKARGGLFTPAVWMALLCGMGCCMPAVALEMFGDKIRGLFDLSPTASNALRFFGVVGPAEEAMKLVIVLALAQLSPDRPAQRTVLTTLAVGIGFALLENLYYVVDAQSTVGVAVLRATTAVPAHTLFALAMGSLVVRAQIYPMQRGLLIAFAFLLAASLHGAYDFLLASPWGNARVSIRMLELGALLAIGAFNRTLPLAQAADEAQGAPWREPFRVSCFILGAGTLVWPFLILVVSGSLRDQTALTSVLTLFPILIGADLVRTAFRAGGPTAAHRHALRI